MLTPDQQYQAGLFCGAARATPTTPINSSGLCAASQYGSTLVSIPAPGTENDDHNPDRVKPRHVFNLGIGTDNLLHTERHTHITASAEIANLTNKVALYNFLSTFSGTHFLQPRSVDVRIGLVF